MNVGTIDRRTAILFGGSLAAMLLLRFVILTDRTSGPVVAAVDSVPVAERRLERLRQISGTVAAKQALVQKAVAEVNAREKGLIKADTRAQAEAQLQGLLHHLGELNGIDIRGMEEARVKPLGNDYGEVSVYVRFTCRIEQLVNFLAALANEEELLSTNQIQVNGGTDKNKTLTVRLGLSGIVNKKIAQEKKGGGL
jgi:hypothetical protein